MKIVSIFIFLLGNFFNFNFVFADEINKNISIKEINDTAKYVQTKVKKKNPFSKKIIPIQETTSGYIFKNRSGNTIKIIDKDNDNIIWVKKTITIDENLIFDGDGDIFIWIGEGDCSQKEGMPPMFIMKEGSTIKNLFMIYAPDGIHIRGGNILIDRVINLDVCEDALSTSSKTNYTNFTIMDSVFLHCEDKGLQFNSGDNINIKNSRFINCAQPIRIPKITKNFVSENNKMTGVASYYYLRSKD